MEVVYTEPHTELATSDQLSLELASCVQHWLSNFQKDLQACGPEVRRRFLWGAEQEELDMREQVHEDHHGWFRFGIGPQEVRGFHGCDRDLGSRDYGEFGQIGRDDWSSP